MDRRTLLESFWSMGLLCESGQWGCFVILVRVVAVRVWSVGLLCEFGQWGCCVSLVSGVAV